MNHYLINCIFTFLAIYNLTLAQTSLDSGLVLYYPFNGEAQDESGNGNHGMVNGVKWVEDRFGNAQSAAFFDGVDDYIRILFSSDFDFSETKQLTVGFWADTLGIGLGRDTRNFGFAFYINSDQGEPYLNVQISASFFWVMIRDKRTEIENWRHYLMTADEKFVSLWVNGIMADRRSLYNVKWEMIRLQDFHIGMTVDAKFEHINFQRGTIDEIRIYNRVLRTEEIKHVYNIN